MRRTSGRASGARMLPAGDEGLVVQLGDAIDPAVNARVRWLARAIGERLGDEVREVIPTYRSVLVLHDPLRVPRARLARRLEALVAEIPAEADSTAPARTVHLPACYGGVLGPDLEFVARQAGLAPDEAVALHAGTTYLVHMLGFTPGFGYFGGLPARLHTPRLETPRPRVAAGSIGIGGQQTGVYPVESPGGWRIIARTPLRLFDPDAERPFLLAAGDHVRFDPVDLDAFRAVEAAVAAGTYAPRVETGPTAPPARARRARGASTGTGTRASTGTGAGVRRAGRGRRR